MKKKGFFAEFKAFISRGNILDLAVGVIIGGAFSAIVTAFTNSIIRPIINLVLALIVGGDGLDAVYTFLKKVYVVEGGVVTTEIDLAKSIYIDWGALIQAVLNFIIVALVLFAMLKIIVKSKKMMEETSKKAQKGIPTKQDLKTMKEMGINILNKDDVKKYMLEKQEKEKQEKLDAEAKRKKEEEEAKRNSTEYLLKEIRDLLKQKNI